MADKVKFYNKYRACFGQAPYRIDGADQYELGLAREWHDLGNKLRDDELDKVFEIAGQICERKRKQKAGTNEINNAIREYRAGNNIEPRGVQRVDISDCWACSDGMMEVPIVTGFEVIRKADGSKDVVTIKRIGLRIDDPKVEVKRVDTCRIFCNCKRGKHESEQYGDFYPVNPEFNQQAYDYMQSLKDHLYERVMVAKRERFSEEDIKERDVHSKCASLYFDKMIRKINSQSKSNKDNKSDNLFAEKLLAHVQSQKGSLENNGSR